MRGLCRCMDQISPCVEFQREPLPRRHEEGGCHQLWGVPSPVYLMAPLRYRSPGGMKRGGAIDDANFLFFLGKKHIYLKQRYMIGFLRKRGNFLRHRWHPSPSRGSTGSTKGVPSILCLMAPLCCLMAPLPFSWLHRLDEGGAINSLPDGTCASVFFRVACFVHSQQRDRFLRCFLPLGTSRNENFHRVAGVVASLHL